MLQQKHVQLPYLKILSEHLAVLKNFLIRDFLLQCNNDSCNFEMSAVSQTLGLV